MKMFPDHHTDAEKKSAGVDVGCSCIVSLILVAVTGAVSIFYALAQFGDFHRQGELPEREVDLTLFARPPVAPEDSAAASGFFFDIGSSSTSVRASMRTRHLEEKGWSGVCAVPFPGDFSGRTCKVVPLPVGGTSGEKLTVRDCSQQSPENSSPLVSAFSTQQMPCPMKEANTVGIVDLLSITGAPAVIDYIGLDTDAAELDILNNFPFNDFCVRSWTVGHNYHTDLMHKIRQILAVAQGCRVREAAGQYWARCTCEKKHDANPRGTSTEDSDSTTKRPGAVTDSEEGDSTTRRPGATSVVMLSDGQVASNP